MLTVTADLEISSEKISHTYLHHYTNGGDLKEIKESAVNEALKAYGNADVLVAPQFDIKVETSSTKVLVTGWPAKYKNLRSISVDGEITKATNENVAGTKSVEVSNTFVQENKQDSQKMTNNATSKSKSVTKSEQDKMCELGLRYLHGDGVTKDVAVALKYLKQAAKENHVKAQYELGCYYWSEKENMGYTMMAEKWITKAAEQGYAPAIEKLKEMRE